MRQFSIKYLMLGTLVAALLLAFVSQEPVAVGMAAFFCVGSWVGILVLSYMTISNLVDTIQNSIRNKQIGGLTARFRWAYLDGFIALWVFITIVISNFVMENSVDNSRYLVWCGWILWSFGLAAMVAKIVWQRRNRRMDAD